MKFPTLDYADLKQEYRIADDPGDPWGTVMSWLFPLAQVLYERNDHDGAIICEMQYRPGAGGNSRTTSVDDYPLWAIKRASTDNLIRFARLLSRYDGFCRAKGLNY